MKKVLFIGLILFISCNKKSALEKDTYTITDKHWMFDTIGKYETSQLNVFYAAKNFIIDENEELYYYTHTPISADCMTNQADYGKPDFIGLEPDKIIELDKNGVEKFIELNILNEKINPTTGKRNNTVAISTEKSTFKSPLLTLILEKINSNAHSNPLWIVRPITDEEKIVLKHKKNGVDYNFYSIKWDSTSINLPNYLK